ncbi:glycosyltransferase family 4 protein [Candidatus Sumerlaeota bacterium]|nr:glycosyltransferase family 4 protein [Candidatus Sumerlaeota bacterium]
MEMNICLISRSLPFHRSGGLEYHTLELAQGLTQRGHKVVLVTTSIPDKNIQPVYHGIHLEPVPGTLPSRYNIRFFRTIAKYIETLHQQYRFDVVHSQGFSALTVNPAKINIPLVVTIHGTLFSETALAKKVWSQLSLREKVQALWHHKARFLLLPLYRRMLTRAACIIVDSSFTRSEILKEQPSLAHKIKLIPLSIKPERFPGVDKIDARTKLGLPTDTMILFTVGRLHKLKGIQTVIEALHRLIISTPDIPEFLYIIGGSGEYRTVLQRLVNNYNLQNKVSFPGRISDSDLPLYYASADVFIYPELSQPAFGLVTLESLMCGTPVIGAESGAIPEVIDPTVGVLFPPGDANALADILRHILQNPQWITEREPRCRPYALNKFSYHAMISNIERVYQDVI